MHQPLAVVVREASQMSLIAASSLRKCPDTR